MANWQKVIAPLAHDIEDHFDRLKNELYRRLGGPGPIKILTYRGFGNRERLYLKGRVLVDKGITPASDNDSLWKNLANMWKRANSREIPGARLLATFQDQRFEIVTDEEGMFVLDFEPASPLPEDRLWHEVSLELLEPRSERQEGPVTAVGRIFVPSAVTKFGVISDIDDTVLVSHATNLLKVARTLFVENARTRLPFPGAAAFYRALAAGTGPRETNPLYYVSSSPWNLYDLLTEFLEFQRFPPRPVLFLRNYGISETEIIPSRHLEYKLGAVRRIIEMHPGLPFILVGDSGQEDPEIYSRALSEYPGRVLAIYIRNVSHELKRAEEIRLLAEKAVAQGVPLVLADDTLTMARHAAEHGWIRTGMLAEIGEEKKEDETPPGPMERLLGEDEKEEGPVVRVEGGSARETEREVERGAIEEAVASGDRKNEKTPPDVIVEADEAAEERKSGPPETPEDAP